MFKYKTDAEVQAMTEQEANDYAIAKRAHEADLQAKAIETALKPVQDELKAVKDENEQLSLKITNIETKGAEKETSFADEIKSRKEDLRKLVKGEIGEITIKGDTVRASIASSASQMILGTIGQLGVKKVGLYDLFRKVQMPSTANDAGKIVYHDWDESTTVRAAAMVAEGTQFPESTARFAKYSVDLKKIGDTLPVSEEFGEDEASAAAELEMFLDVNVSQKRDQQIAIGDNTGQNLAGLYPTAPAYTPTAQGIADANIKDLARRMRTTIVKTRGSKYAPDFIAANSDVIDQYILKKDANNNYIFDAQTGTIAGLMIVEDNNLSDNTLVIGDSRFGTIYEKGGFSIEKVYVNAQAIEDMVTLKARKRMLMLIRNVDKTGFLKCTDIAAALTTLETPVA